MEVRQIATSGVGGLKYVNRNCVCTLKYDGSNYLIHIKNEKAYALTSKRLSVKTKMFNNRIDNIPELKNIKFVGLKKETILECEVNAEHLYKTLESEYGYHWNKRANFVASIMNAKPETVEEKYPRGNPLKLVVLNVLYYNGVDVSNLSYGEKTIILRDLTFIPYAGKMSEKIGKGILYKISPFSLDYIGCVDEDNIFDYIQKKEFIYEGIVVNEMNSNNAMKIKKIGSVDAIIIGYDTESTGKYAENGWIKSVRIGLLKNSIKIKGNRLTKENTEFLVEKGALIEVGKISGMSEEIRQQLSENKDIFIGVPVEVEFLFWTGKALRHPRWKGIRDDKFVSRCTLEQVV